MSSLYRGVIIKVKYKLLQPGPGEEGNDDVDQHGGKQTY